MSATMRASEFMTAFVLVIAAGLTGLGEPHSAIGAQVTIPEPQNQQAVTKDGVVIHFTYYPGGYVQGPAGKDKQKTEVTRIPGKEVVPVVLLHGWEGQRRQFDFTASSLQRMGHAVVVPDLRGHGDSTTVKLGALKREISREKMRPADMGAMTWDVQAVKRFLFEKNNAQELNIELLCVVGAEFGAIVATNWAAMDWSQEPLPSFKQGRDVKALVLLSPLQTYKGVNLTAALQHPAIRNLLSVMIVAGKEDSQGSQDAKAIHSRLERARSRTLPTDPAERLKVQDLFLLEPPTSLRGVKLLTSRDLTVNQDLARFIYLRLVSKKGDLPWSERKSPLD